MPLSRRASPSRYLGRSAPWLSTRRWQIQRGRPGRYPDGNGPWENVTTRSPAGFATTAYLLYDDKNLYVGFKADQAGVPIVATQTTNDVGFGIDDFVGIGVDTSGSWQPSLLLRDDAARHPLRTG